MWNRLGVIALFVLAASCPKPVDQNVNSGEDSWYKGALELELDDDGDGQDIDRVTYPGGDRVDWKRIDLPEGYQGKLKIKLRFTPPRRGLDLAFIVYDRKFRRVKRARPSPNSGARTKKVRIEGAKGRYYIQVYAPRRKDAGDYVLTVEFRGVPVGVEPIGLDAGIEVDDPPDLPDIDPSIYDVVDAGVRPPRVDAMPPPPDAAPKKVIDGKITNRKEKRKRVEITINRGANFDIKRGWKGHLLRGDSDQPLPGGEFIVSKVTARESHAKVKLSVDQVQANPRVRIFEP